ncbi:MAG: ribbon-helix-helix protein, CopG family [Acidobacteria bacterium]|nr:ribbon-helix-helix protein, CopG family [Acidobacteriota bacterium]
MKTTLVIDDGVMKRLRQEAARKGTTISALVEAALRLFLENRSRAAPEAPALPSFDGGGAFVDIADRDALYRAMEGR